MRPREIHLLIFCIDVTLLIVSFVVVKGALHIHDSTSLRHLLGILLPCYVIISPIFVEDLRNFKIEFLKMSMSLVKRFIYFFALSALVLICCEQGNIPRKQLLATILVFFILKWGLSTWYFFKYSFKTNLYLKSTVIIGNNRLGINLYNYFIENKHLGIRPIGILSEVDVQPDDLSVLGSVDNFQEVFDKTSFEDAFIVLPLPDEKLITRLIALAERNGVRIHVVPNYVGKQKIYFKTGNIGNVPLLEVHSFPLDVYAHRFQKRMFDIIFASIAFVLLIPIGLLIALLIKLTNKGPVIFQVYRLGVNGIPFKFYKFRTMIHDPSNSSQDRSTVLNDSRITPIGKFLRKYSLDELPQLLNVLNNDMSLVGPRPHRINLNKDLQQKMGNYMMRHTIKPGITGWAQVNGWRGPTVTKMQYWGRTLHDLWYIENWTLALDFYIILLTIVGRKTKKNAF